MVAVGAVGEVVVVVVVVDEEAKGWLRSSARALRLTDFCVALLALGGCQFLSLFSFSTQNKSSSSPEPTLFDHLDFATDARMSLAYVLLLLIMHLKQDTIGRH